MVIVSLNFRTSPNSKHREMWKGVVGMSFRARVKRVRGIQSNYDFHFIDWITTALRAS